MRRRLMILLLLSVSMVKGQELSFRQVDTTTYSQYLRGDWKGLIETGKQALENDINYYYLQMRMAYACFSLEQYRKAAHYYKQALQFNRTDAIANEYLYYSYSYGGMYHDAQVQEEALTGQQKTAMGINGESNFRSFGILAGRSGSNAHNIVDDIADAMQPAEDGTQKATYGISFLQANLSHAAGSRLIVDHGLSLLRKNELSYVVTGGSLYLSEEQPVNQFEYQLNVEITPMTGMVINPFIHYLNTSIPLYLETSYGRNIGADRIPVSNLKLRHWVPGISIEQKASYFDIGASFVYHTINTINTSQAGIHASYYPFANLNLYFSLDAYLQWLSYNDNRQRQLIFKPLAGFKVHRNLWMEISATSPDHINFYDVRNNIAFNNLEMNRGSLEVNGIIPLYKSGNRLFIGYRYQALSSGYFPVNNLTEPIHQIEYNSHLITGGIQWK